MGLDCQICVGDHGRTSGGLHWVCVWDMMLVGSHSLDEDAVVVEVFDHVIIWRLRKDSIMSEEPCLPK